MRAVRVIQTSAIAMLLVATSLMLVASAHASERHRIEERAEAYRQATEYPHIHGKRDKYEHPPLHSEGTRDDDDSEPLYNDYRDPQYSDETEEDDE